MNLAKSVFSSKKKIVIVSIIGCLALTFAIVDRKVSDSIAAEELQNYITEKKIQVNGGAKPKIKRKLLMNIYDYNLKTNDENHSLRFYINSIGSFERHVMVDPVPIGVEN